MLQLSSCFLEISLPAVVEQDCCYKQCIIVALLLKQPLVTAGD